MPKRRARPGRKTKVSARCPVETVPLLDVEYRPALAVARYETALPCTLSLATSVARARQRWPRSRVTLTVTDPDGAVTSKSTTPVQVSLKYTGGGSPVEESTFPIPFPRSAV
jgi:hypothetical protein